MASRLTYSSQSKNGLEGAPCLIVFTGESNSGGQASNNAATAYELSQRPSVQILNNNSFTFEALHIAGGNNLYGHYGLDPEYLGVMHGWELELANLVEGGRFPAAPCYLVKTGQGGSKISQWNEGDRYYTSFIKRVDAAIAGLQQISGAAPRMFIVYSQGINDAISNVDVSTWKAATIAHIDKIRTRYGAEIPFIVTLFMNTFSLAAAYNNAIVEISNELKGIYTVVGADLTRDDIYHWDYNGMKKLADRLLGSVANLL